MSMRIATVEAFFAECAKGPTEMHAAFNAYFTAATIWENVRMPTTTGADAALALLTKLERRAGFDRFSAEMLAIAERHDSVLTERVDRVYNAAGAVMHELRVMGMFELAGDKITRWTDYFSP